MLGWLLRVAYVDALLERPDPHQFADDGRHVGVKRRALDVLVEHVTHHDELAGE